MYLEKDQQYIWHAMGKKNSSFRPLIVEKAEGVWVEDVEQNRYIDAMSGLWCVNIGYGREELVDAASEQMKKMAYYPMSHSHVPAIELGEQLNNWLDGEYVIFFSNSGSEANEVAFKIARQFHHQKGESGRYKILSRYRSYHGNTMGALAATGQAQRKYKYEPLANGFIHTVPPDCYHCPMNEKPESCHFECAKMIDQTLTWELDETVAAVIMEPMITGGGVLIPPEGYLQEVEKICKRHGVLLIIDEVICGFGRTGEKFGFMHEGIKPDIITMAKGITSGYLPLAATAVKKEIFDAFSRSEQYEHFRHINTFGGNPAACALAIKNLELLEKEQMVQQSQKSGDYLGEEMKELYQHPNVGDIRSKGLLMGIEFVEDKLTRKPIDVACINQLITHCKEEGGVIIGKNGDTVAGFNNVLTLAPPLCIEKEELNTIISAVKKAVKEVLIT
ncbi:aspartate aminotransferase family protein [Evansella vedderi]|nr:aspartate aminotransferase family protein [Evansella vedderi]